MNATAQQEWWAGAGGDAYTERNRVNWRARVPFWHRVIEFTGARSVYEFGCNAGWNLSAIRRYSPDVRCHGHDINVHAAERARAAGLDVSNSTFGIDRLEDTYDLVFTAGVLIHIPPADLESFMRGVMRLSAQYVLAIEYEAPTEEEIEYRGEGGLLWKRPYGELYEKLGLRLTLCAQNWPELVGGFDNCTAWLMEKS